MNNAIRLALAIDEVTRQRSAVEKAHRELVQAHDRRADTSNLLTRYREIIAVYEEAKAAMFDARQAVEQ